MKRFVRGTIAALAVTFVGAAGAEAQPLTELEKPPCEKGDVFHMAVDFEKCAGNFDGNNAGANESDVIEYINIQWGLGVASGSTTNADDDPGVGPFQDFGDDLGSGTLWFDNPVSGDFVVGLKAADFFSLYLFRKADNWNRLEFNTLGVAPPSRSGDPKGLSHATLYGGTVTVPEPTSMLLLGTGLIGLGIVARRRREEDPAA